MRSRTRLALPAALILAFAMVPSASAASNPVQIDIHADFFAGETFTSSGFCPSGEAVSYNFGAAGRGRAITFHLFKDLICEDGTGTLTIRVEAAFVFGTPGTIGGWNVVGGTGDYSRVRGGGSLVGIGFDTGIDDTYTGRLTN